MWLFSAHGASLGAIALSTATLAVSEANIMGIE
jgi:hypothetical protein